MRQGLLEVGVRGDTVIYLVASVINLTEPLVHADDRDYTGRRPQHADVLRTPITYSDDADPNSLRSHRA